nr:MAG TPA: hypothetical protein [Caudoviricetes sp.]
MLHIRNDTPFFYRELFRHFLSPRFRKYNFILLLRICQQKKL